MKLVFVTAEAVPFAKTGGLGEVMGSLPAFLRKQGADVRVIMPKYSAIAEHFRQEMVHLAHFTVSLSWRKLFCGLDGMVYNGVPYYFVDNEYYFSRPGLYGQYDDGERFAFFSRAALESLLHIPGFKPDVIHSHDWHTALVPLMLKAFYNRHPLYYPIKTVFTVHNLKYQMVCPEEVLGDILGLGWEYFAADALEFHGGINFMKAALVYADQITTVSPTYANEIQDPYYGEGLDGLLRARNDSLVGILNGIDYVAYDPKKDPYLAMPYGNNVSLAKKENKKQLQQVFGLPVVEGKAVLGMVSRLVEQKGLDLLIHVLDEILGTLNVQMVVLGTGDGRYEEALRYFAAKYPDQLALRFEFSERIEHQIYGGADMFLMPSRFEPCGISQMIAMHYGTIPVVRETGGLKDTVKNYDELTGEGNGFSFANYNAHDFLYTVQRAVSVFENDREVWQNIVRKAMLKDFSWKKSAKAYSLLYQSLL